MTRFIFNSDNFQYEEVKVESRRIWVYLGLSVAFSVLISGVFLFAFNFFSIDIKQIILTKRYETHFGELSMLSNRLSEIEVKLGRLHQNDNGYYRSILNIEKIDANLWNGGIGGTERYSNLAANELRQFVSQIDKLNYKLSLQQRSFHQIQKVARVKSEELKHIPALSPLKGKVMSGFGYRRDPFHGFSQFHQGLDIDGDIGDKIYASGDGVIITAGSPEGGYGLQVEIDHNFNYVTKYAHMSKIAVRIGQKVKRGDVIGYVGNTGYSKGAHLHYEVIKKGEKVNPIDYLYIE